MTIRQEENFRAVFLKLLFRELEMKKSSVVVEEGTSKSCSGVFVSLEENTLQEFNVRVLDSFSLFAPYLTL